MTRHRPAPTVASRTCIAVGGLGVLGSAGVALAALNLRPGATSVGPVLEEVRHGVGLDGTAAGLMTSLPCLCFGLIGALAVALAKRIGVTSGILVGLLAVVLGLALRSFTSNGALFILLSAAALGGMALGNVLVPAWIKRHATDGGIRAMSLYGAGLTLGGSLGSFASAPLEQHCPGGWRAALLLWAAVAALAVIPWTVLARRERRVTADHVAPMEAPQGALRRSPTAIALTLYFGMQSLNAYVQFGWLAQLWRDAGLSAVQAGLWLAVLGGLGVVGGVVMPGVIARPSRMTVAVVVLGAMLLIGYAGLLVAPARMPWLWAVILGISGWTFPGAVALVTARTREPHVTAQLSGFVQPIGYLVAAAGPLAAGIIHQMTHSWSVVLLMLMATGLVMISAGLVVARRGDVDDELFAQRAGSPRAGSQVPRQG